MPNTTMSAPTLSGTATVNGLPLRWSGLRPTRRLNQAHLVGPAFDVIKGEVSVRVGDGKDFVLVEHAVLVEINEERASGQAGFAGVQAAVAVAVVEDVAADRASCR